MEVFGSMFCPYCRQARRFLDEKAIAYEYREVPMLFGWKPPTGIFREMKRRSGGQTTVPQIFVGGAHYGDEERLFADEKSGRLGESFAPGAGSATASEARK